MARRPHSTDPSLTLGMTRSDVDVRHARLVSDLVLFRLCLTIVLAVFPTILRGEPIVVSIEPESGPVTGGTEVTIRGSGFLPAPDGIRVQFENLPAANYTVVDANTIHAVTPSHLPGTVRVSVCNNRTGCSSLYDAFTFSGEATDARDAILLPILQESPGLYGTQWFSALSIFNSAPVPLLIEGLEYHCHILCPSPRFHGVTLYPGRTEEQFQSRGAPGRLIYVPEGSGERIRFTLTVHNLADASRRPGTEIPVIREDEFFSDKVTLVRIPVEAGYRVHLRIYGLKPEDGEVLVRVYRFDSFFTEQRVGLYADDGFHDHFFPAYAEMRVDHEFPLPQPASIRLEIFPLTEGQKIWAFATVTDNETQQVTTVTPQ